LKAKAAQINSFKCFDLVLASGANTVTLHASDLAGNLTTSNFVFNLNYSNKPAPVMTLWWPQNGAQISGSSFTWRGTVDDPTVTLSAQITDSSGDTNVVAGVVERNGNFWVDNIPLAPGTNWLTLTATDINNHVTSNNIYVVQSGLAMTINPVTIAVNQGTTAATGTINASNYTVWVNGVATSQSGSLPSISWIACNVPANGTGSAVFQACAITNSKTNNLTGGGGGTNSSLTSPGNPTAPGALFAEINPDKQGGLILTKYYRSWSDVYNISQPQTDPPSMQCVRTGFFNWSSQAGGSSQSTYCLTGYATDGTPVEQSYSLNQSQWDTNGNDNGQFGSSTQCGSVSNLTSLGYRFSEPTSFYGLQGRALQTQTGNDAQGDSWTDTETEAAGVQYTLKTGGRSLPRRQHLWCLTADAWQVVNFMYPNDGYDWSYNMGEGDTGEMSPVAPQQVVFGGQPEQPDGVAYVTLMDGEEFNPQPSVTSIPCVLLDPSTAEYQTQIWWGTSNVTGSNTTVIVGQQITLGLTLGSGAPAMSNFNWTVPGTTESQFYVSEDLYQTNGYPIPLTLTNTNTVSFFWVDAGTKTVTCSAVCGGATTTATATFNVLGPSATITATPGSVRIGTDSRGLPIIAYGNSTNLGMAFSNISFSIPAGFTNYNTEWIQILTSISNTITISNTATGSIVPHVRQTGQPTLDHFYPYYVRNTNNVSDSPSVPLYVPSESSATDSRGFKMWFMIQPLGGNYVPLCSATWSVSGTATGYGGSVTNWASSAESVGKFIGFGEPS
jgi:hypothetical protein